MVPFAGDAVASKGDYLLALAQGLTALLGITAAILIFVLDRLVRRYRVHDRAYNVNLFVFSIASAFTILLSALTWWAWASAAPGGHLLFCLSAKAWIAILFGSITLAAILGFLFGLSSMASAFIRGHSDDWAP